VAIVLGDNRYGKAEIRLVRVVRDTEFHTISDLNVSVALSGDLTDTHLTGDNAKVLPTDSQKNAVYAFARTEPIAAIEEFGLRLARYFVGDVPTVSRARVTIVEYPWDRIAVAGNPHPHAFRRAGDAKYTTQVTCGDGEVSVVSGVEDLVVLKSAGSEFHGYLKDRHTTLAETHDRILATAVTARWRYGPAGVEQHRERDPDWNAVRDDALRVLLETFATTHSLSLQQTLYAMGRAVLQAQPDLAEIRLSLPNRHHFLVDLAAFGLDNPNLVFHADDRPYGLVEATVRRDDMPDAPQAW
jgi:urate oxidase